MSEKKVKKSQNIQLNIHTKDKVSSKTNDTKARNIYYKRVTKTDMEKWKMTEMCCLLSVRAHITFVSAAHICSFWGGCVGENVKLQSEKSIRHWTLYCHRHTKWIKSVEVFFGCIVQKKVGIHFAISANFNNLRNWNVFVFILSGRERGRKRPKNYDVVRTKHENAVTTIGVKVNFWHHSGVFTRKCHLGILAIEISNCFLYELGEQWKFFWLI